MGCECPPSKNRVCKSIESLGNLISVTQPECVNLADGSLEVNPYIDTSNNRSYWAYKVVVNCNDCKYSPRFIYILINENIMYEDLQIEERIITKQEFKVIDYIFESPPEVTPPRGFKFVKISVQGRYTTGTCALYRFSINGIYPVAIQPIYVITIDEEFLYFRAPYDVPGLSLNPRIVVTKQADVIIDNNDASIEYEVNIMNTGNSVLTNVMYDDTIRYDGQNIRIGQITVVPDFINIDTSVGGEIRLFGDIGTLEIGESFEIRYVVPILNFSQPNIYSFVSNVIASSGDVKGITNNIAQIEVVEFITANVCEIPSEDIVEFVNSLKLVEGSPKSKVMTRSVVNIPEGVVVKVLDFSGCKAYYADDQQEVEVGDIVTNRQIVVECIEEIIPNSISFNVIKLQIISIDVANIPYEIVNRFESVELLYPDKQVSLGAFPLPNIVQVLVGIESICNNPCE